MTIRTFILLSLRAQDNLQNVLCIFKGNDLVMQLMITTATASTALGNPFS